MGWRPRSNAVMVYVPSKSKIVASGMVKFHEEFSNHGELLSAATEDQIEDLVPEEIEVDKREEVRDVTKILEHRKYFSAGEGGHNQGINYAVVYVTTKKEKTQAKESQISVPPAAQRF